MALRRHNGQRCVTSGGTGDLHPKVWLEMGQSGRLQWASSLEKKRDGKERKKVGRLGIRPSRDLENSKGFPFSNLFTNIKLIWSQFKFKF
jgi:hypothetical protein